MEQLGGRTLHNNPLISIVFHKKNDTLTSQLFFAGLARLHVRLHFAMCLMGISKKVWNFMEHCGEKDPF